MAVNSNRSMREDLELGIREGSYMQLNPMWGGLTSPSVERLSWPTYAQVERHQDVCGCYHEITPREAPPFRTDADGQLVVPADNPAL